MTTITRSTTFFLFLLVLIALAMPAASDAQVSVGVSIRIGPPPLPVYVQPPPPYPGYIWTPGYWAYGPEGYYWVPGTWVEPPAVGLLWTPGYWGWRNGFYVWNAGYWGPHVGFYGGINYGFGYTGVGFVGGGWRGGVYTYNRAVTNVNTTNVTIIHNTYNTTVVNNTTVINRTSFNGGPGGINARATGAEQAAFREHHVAPTGLQMQHEHTASGNRELLASVNHGRPSVAASPRAGEFHVHEVNAANNLNHSTNASNGNGPKNGTIRNDRPLNAGMNGNSSNTGNSHAYKSNPNYGGSGYQTNAQGRYVSANNSHTRVQEVHNTAHGARNQHQGGGHDQKDRR